MKGMNIDFIQNGQGSGSVADRLLANNLDTNVLRPYSLPTGRLVNGRPEYRGTYVTMMRYSAKAGKVVPTPVQVSNATATLRKDEWIAIDRAIVQAARPRTKLITALRQKGLTYAINDPMSKTVLQSQSVSDISEADISMDGLRQSAEDRPLFDIYNLPLPIIHKDFSFSLREIAVSRSGGQSIDTTTAELASRKVSELAEKLSIGTYGTYSYGGGTIYGLTNNLLALTQALTDPTDSDWDGGVLVTEILEMIQKSQDNFYYGPWFIFHSPGWNKYLGADYSDAKGDNTLRQRIEAIPDIDGMMSLDFLTGLQIILVQLTPDVIRIVTGMDVTTLQWETSGGLELHFKVMAMITPQIRGDFYGRTGIVHGSVT